MPRIAGLMVAAAALLALMAPAAFAAASIGPLRLGSATGSEDYLYAAGNQVFAPAPAGLTPSDAYRYEVLAPDGSVKHTLTTCFPGNAATGDSFTVGPLDTPSGASGYRWVVEDFTGGNKNANVATCNGAAAGTGTVVATKYFDVVVATVDNDPSLSGGHALIAPTQTEYARFAGAVNRNPDTGVATAVATGSTAPQWNVKWLNGSATACQNTFGADRPDSSSTGALPASSPAYLQFPPVAGASGIFNDATSYDGLCSIWTGAYSAELRLLPASGDATLSKQFVQLPTFNVDATAPALTLNVPGDTHVATPSFSGSAGTQGASSSAFADVNSVAIRIYSGATTTGTPTASFTKTTSSGAWSLSSADWSTQSQPALPEGLYTVVVEQSDTGGNTQQQTGLFKVDTTPPPVTLTSPASGTETGDTTPAFSGAAGNGGALTNATADQPTVTLRIYSGHGASGSPLRTIPVTKSGNQWSVGDQQWTDNSQAALGAGTYTAQAEQFDGAGNQGLSGAVTFKVDPVAPAVDIGTPANGLNTTGTTPAIAGISGTLSSTDFTSTDLATVTVNIYSGTDTSGAAQRTFRVNGGGGSWSIGGADWAAQGALTQGQWTIQATQSDSAGNVGASSARTIRVDQQAPFSGTSVIGSTNNASITVSYTDADIGSSQSGVGQIALYAKGPADSAFAQVASVSNPAASGTFSYTATEGQGRYFFATVATDNAGNSETPPSAGGVGKAFTHYDTTAPTVTLDTWPAIGNGVTPALSGTAGASSGTGEPAADSPTVTIDIWSGTDTNQLPARSIPVTRSGGDWTVDDSAWNIADPTRAPLTEGTWTAVARQSDEAGNTGASTTPRTIVVDLTPPVSSDDVPATWQRSPVAVTLRANESGAAIHYTTDGSTPSLSSPTYSSPITLGNGGSIRYFAVDTAGNAETPHTSPAAKVDQQAPTTTDNVPPTFQAHDVTVTLTANDTGGSGLDKTYYTTNGTDPTTASAVYNAASPPVLHDGERIRYFSTDIAGNAESVKTSAAAHVDKTAPASQVASPQYAHSQTFDVPYSASDGGSGLKKVELWAQAPGDSSYSLAATDNTPGPGRSFSYTGSVNGVYSFYTLAEDNVGNREIVDTASSQVTSTLLDTVAPTTTDNAPHGYVNHDIAVSLSASDSGSGIDKTYYTTDGSVPSTSSSVYSSATTVPLTSDGQQLKYRSIDRAGNQEDVHTVTAHIDRAAPTTHASGPAATNSPAFTIGYTASDTGGSGLEHVALFAKGPSDSAFAQVASDASPASGDTFSYSATQGDGAYRFYTVGYDNAGNVQTIDSSDGGGDVAKVTLDRVAPAVTLTTPADGDVLTTATPHLGGAAGTASGDSPTVRVWVYSGSSATGTPVQTKTPPVANGAWGVDADTLADGTYTVQAQQSDAAGNPQTTAANTFTVDSHPPVTTITAPLNGARTNDATPTIQGTGSMVSGDLPQVTVRVYSGSLATGSATQVKTAPVQSDGTWALDANSLADGTYTVQSDQADSSNNHGHSDPVTFTVDTAAPSSQASSPALSRSNSIGVSYSAEDAAGGTGLAKVELWSAGPDDTSFAKVAEDGSPGSTGTISYAAAKGDGTYRFYTIAVDRAGNREATGGSDSTTNLDTHSPSITSGNQGQTYAQGSSVAADYTCADEAGGSGIDSCSGEVARGAPLDTATPGPHSYRVMARDRAGNELGATISYTVAEQHVEGTRQDTQAPDLSAAGTRRSQALSGGALTVDVVCSEQCDATAGGTIAVPGAARVYKLKTVARNGAAGAHVKLKLKLDAKTLKAVRKAIRKHRKVTARVKITASDAAGNHRTSTLSVRVTRA